MSDVNINPSSPNTVTIQNTDNIITVTDDSKHTEVNITQEITDIVNVVAQGPQGIRGLQGPAGPGFDEPFTGSVIISGSIQLIGDQILTGSLILSGSSTFTNVGPTILSGSVISTEGFSGSFSGSFSGDGSNLSNVPASGIVGLNLSQIASGSATASISPDNGFFVNTNISASAGTTASFDHIDVAGDIIGVDGTTFIGDGGGTNYDLSVNNRIFLVGGTPKIYFGSTGSPYTLSRSGTNILIGLTEFQNGQDLAVYRSLQVGKGTTGHITASGDISASGDIIGNDLLVRDGRFSRDGFAAEVEIIASETAGGIVGTNTSDDLKLRRFNVDKLVLEETQNISKQNFNVEGNISASGDITAGDITAFSLNVVHLTSSFITSSTIQTSGSNIFGDDTSDIQTLIGTVKMTGSAEITGSLKVINGTYAGDGSGLINIPASGITGLNLSQIADGTATASISETNGFIVNTDSKITGSLTVSGSQDIKDGNLTISGSSNYSIIITGSSTQNATNGSEIAIVDTTRHTTSSNGYGPKITLKAAPDDSTYGNITTINAISTTSGGANSPPRTVINSNRPLFYNNTTTDYNGFALRIQNNTSPSNRNVEHRFHLSGQGGGYAHIARSQMGTGRIFLHGLASSGIYGMMLKASKDDYLIIGPQTSATDGAEVVRITPTAFKVTGNTEITGDITSITEITASGNISSSATSTSSFGTYLGDGSQLDGVQAFPFTGDAQITGSLTVSGSTTSNIILPDAPPNALVISGSTTPTRLLIHNPTLNNNPAYTKGAGIKIESGVSAGSRATLEIAAHGSANGGGNNEQTFIHSNQQITIQGASNAAGNHVKLAGSYGGAYLTANTSNTIMHLYSNGGGTPAGIRLGQASWAHIKSTGNAAYVKIGKNDTEDWQDITNDRTIFSGNISGSTTSTASFGTYIGDGSQLSGISTPPFPFSGSAIITGSLTVSGSITTDALSVDGTSRILYTTSSLVYSGSNVTQVTQSFENGTQQITNIIYSGSFEDGNPLSITITGSDGINKVYTMTYSASLVTQIIVS